MAAPLLEARSLSRRFSNGKVALESVTFTVEKGETVALVGDNGAGKTTLLKILANVILPSSGELRCSAPRSRIAWVPATENNFTPLLTGEENLRYWHAFTRGSRDAWERTIRSFSDLAPFREALRTPYVCCSTGMKQSLSLARAFLQEPSLVLMDEPTRSLDRPSVAWLERYLNEAGAAVLFSSHQAGVVDSVATRKLQLQGGRLV